MEALHPDRARSSEGSLLAFFLLTFAATWTCFLLAVRITNHHPHSPGPTLTAQGFILLGTFAPALVALWLTRRAEGDAGVRALLARLVRWNVGRHWYAFALGYMALAKLVVALLHRALTGAWPAFSTNSVLFMLAATLFSTVSGGQTGEELGWRGYALPRLAGRFGLGGASVVLGVIWAMWHLPLFYLRGVDTYGQSFPAYLLQVVALSVAIAWLWWRTGGSLLLTMLMHAAINNTKDIVPSLPRAIANPLLPHASLTSWLGVVVLWIAAVGFLVHMARADRGAFTSRSHAT